MSAPPIPAPFFYNAIVLSWHDGDSGQFQVDRGMRDYSTWAIRLDGCNTRELSMPGGPEARDEVARRLPPGTPVVLSTVKPDKYGERKDARVFYVDGGVARDLVADLIAEQWAAPWDGSGKQPVSQWPRTVA